MDIFEFGETCKPYNIKYRELFDNIPCPADYVCTKEEYLTALKNAIRDEKEIGYYLTEAAKV